MKIDPEHCKPPAGKTYLTIGQDLFSIDEYLRSLYNESLHNGSAASIASFSPAAAMTYTDIKELNGLDLPIDYGSGVEFANGLVDSIFAGQNIGLQIGLWLNGTYGCNQINSGQLDGQIENLSKYLSHKTKVEKVEIFLRIGYEFDNPWFGFQPDLYVKAYRKIANALESIPGLHFVWHSWAAPRREPLESFYPGDAYVDWVGVSVFQQVYDDKYKGANSGTISDIEEVLHFASSHNKPTMIAESTPFGGINNETMVKRNLTMDDAWDLWFDPVLDLVEKHDISMWCYINCDWDSQPMWNNIGFGDTRLSSNKYVTNQWQKYVLNADGKHDRFLMANSFQKCGRSRYNIIPDDHRIYYLFFILLLFIPILHWLYVSHRRFHNAPGTVTRVKNERTNLIV